MGWHKLSAAPVPTAAIRTPKQHGFVLIAVLGMIMLLSLIASFVASYAEQRLNQTLELRSRWQQELDQQATLATVQYMLATHARTNGGWQFSANEILRVDGRPYYGIGNALFAVQDEGSLLSLLDPDRERWQRLLYKQGLSASQTEQFLDQLQDYTDQDDLRRLNGATSTDYLQAGLEPPPQRLMVSPGQVFNLFNAQQWQAVLHDILPLSTIHSGQLNNINTAPQEVLATLVGGEDSLWQALVEARSQQPFINLSDANQRLGQILPLDPFAVPTLPSPYVRLQLWLNKDDCRQATWIGLTLTPNSNRVPWDINYVFNYQQPQPCRAPVALAATPLAR